MKTLDEWNAERTAKYMEEAKRLSEMSQPHPNEISCPTCGKELWDSNPMMILDSMPQQKNVHCPGCGYRGYRVI